MQMSAVRTAGPRVWTWFMFVACVAAPAVAFAEPTSVRAGNAGDFRPRLESARGDRGVLALGEGRRLVFSPSEDEGAVSGGDEAPARGKAKRSSGGTRRASYGGRLPAEASAIRLSGRLMFGLGGEEAEQGAMVTTYGFALGLEAPVHRYISLGAAIQFAKWNLQMFDELGVGRSTLYEVVVLPKLRYPIVTDDHLLELYAGPVLGVSNNVFNDQLELDDAGSALGVTVGVFAGATYFVSPKVGLTFELGYQHRSYSSGDEDLSLGQFGVNAGLLITL